MMKKYQNEIFSKTVAENSYGESLRSKQLLEKFVAESLMARTGKTDFGTALLRIAISKIEENHL